MTPPTQVFALLGVHSFPSFRKIYPWLVPVHIALYLVHMFQEIYDVWEGVPWFKLERTIRIKRV